MTEHLPPARTLSSPETTTADICRRVVVYSQDANWIRIELKFANSTVSGRIGMHVLRTNRALTVIVSLQPINANYRRDAVVRDQ